MTKTSFDIIAQGTVSISPADELKKKLDTGRQLNIKFGIDPTTPDIHLGHCVALRKLRQFQNLGHKVLLVIGDHTARIGDPTGRDKTRPELSVEEVNKNAKTYLNQAKKIIDSSLDKLWVGNNSSWLDNSYILKNIVSDFTVQQLLHRNDFKKRMEAGNPISILELLYPAFQAYDSVAIKPDVEIGGTDQTFNMQLARGYQIKRQQDPQVVITMPLLVGLDGKEKMSKSKGNHIGVMDEPNDMFGKLMSISDDLTTSYMELLTGDARDDLKHPMARKNCMAIAIVSIFYGAEIACNAANEFTEVFRNKKLPTNIETKHIGPGWHNLVDVIVNVGFASSKTQARKLLEAGAVRLDGDKAGGIKEIQLSNGSQILKVGKRRICKLKE